MRSKRTRKIKLKAATWKALTISLAIISALITARTTYLISPLPFDDFQVWRESQMQYVFAIFMILLIANISLPLWAIRKNKLKIATIGSALICIIPLVWLVKIFSLSV